MARLRAIIDSGDTVECAQFSLPSANTLTQKRALQMSVESEGIELIFMDDAGSTGDTVDWGVRMAVVTGVTQRRDESL
jgi:hypothetical protein